VEICDAEYATYESRTVQGHINGMGEKYSRSVAMILAEHIIGYLPQNGRGDNV